MGRAGSGRRVSEDSNTFSAVTVKGALVAVPLVATGPVAIGAAEVLVMVPAVVEVTLTPT